MHDFTVWVFYGKWRKNGDIRYCLLHLIHLSSTRLRRCGQILSGICEPYCLITPDLTMRYCPILILIDYIFAHKKTAPCELEGMSNFWGAVQTWKRVFRRPFRNMPCRHAECGAMACRGGLLPDAQYSSFLRGISIVPTCFSRLTSKSVCEVQASPKTFSQSASTRTIPPNSPALARVWMSAKIPA